MKRLKKKEEERRRQSWLRGELGGSRTLNGPASGPRYAAD